jgi:predicted phosphodiesterase
MRIALLAGIHGNLAALEAVLEDAARRKADRVVTLGAHVSGPLLPAETATFMMARPWHQICGNHDRQLLSNDLENLGASDKYARQCLNTAHLRWLSNPPSSARIEEDVFLCHGSPRSDSEFLLETIEPVRVRRASSAEIDQRLGGEAATVVLCGHSVARQPG